MWIVTFGGKVLRRRALSLQEVRGIHARSLSCAEACSQRAALAEAADVLIRKLDSVWSWGNSATPEHLDWLDDLAAVHIVRLRALVAEVRVEVSDG